MVLCFFEKALGNLEVHSEIRFEISLRSRLLKLPKLNELLIFRLVFQVELDLNEQRISFFNQLFLSIVFKLWKSDDLVAVVGSFHLVFDRQVNVFFFDFFHKRAVVFKDFFEDF